MLTKQRLARKKRIRAKISGTKEIPRLSVFRSNKAIYAQLIDDTAAQTILEAHGTDAKKVGSEISEKAKKEKVGKIVFDRGGYQYHGKIKALAEAAREGGLKF